MTRCNVIVVIYNSAATLPDFFAGLEANADSIEEVVVVDNGSNDESLSMARALLEKSSLFGHTVAGANVGFAGGHWAASREFGRDDLPTLCVNPDVALADGVVAGMLGVLHRFPNAAIVSAPLIGRDGVEDSASRRTLPTVASGAMYSVLGKLLPKRMRYNAQGRSTGHTVAKAESGRSAVSRVEATTGALMLIADDFRPVTSGIFDQSYWMYGEDLQLCFDARESGRVVLIAEEQPSVHLKGASSGWPRSWRSNVAFHDAMYLYYAKNLSRSRIGLAVFYLLSRARLALSGAAGLLSARANSA